MGWCAAPSGSGQSVVESHSGNGGTPNQLATPPCLESISTSEKPVKRPWQVAAPLLRISCVC
jgi:hypothetical protein